MTSFITRTVLAATVALGAFGAAAQANAAQVDVVVRTPHIVVRKPVIVVRPSPVVVIKPVLGGRCAPALALQKAANHGLNKVAVSFVGPNRITVTGKTHGMWVKMTFANVPGCPRA